jgi:hypothetical protein
MIEVGKLTSAIYLHNPRYPENYNHPETGRQNYIHAIAYEIVNTSTNKCRMDISIGYTK